MFIPGQPLFVRHNSMFICRCLSVQLSGRLGS